MFDTTQQRQQKCHTTLNDLEKATKQLYNCSIAAKVLENQRRAKAEADSAQLPLQHLLVCKKRQEQAKVTGIATTSANDTDYPDWDCQPCHKTPGPDVPQLYATPKETDATGHDVKLNKELGLDNIFDPLALGDASPAPGPQTPLVYGDDATTIPPIHLPTLGGSGDSGISGLTSGVASPITKCDNRLLDGLPRGLPMVVGALLGIQLWSRIQPQGPHVSRLTCSAWSEHRGILKRLLDTAPKPTAFADAMKRMPKQAEKKQQEEDELPYPTHSEDDPDWM